MLWSVDGMAFGCYGTWEDGVYCIRVVWSNESK